MSFKVQNMYHAYEHSSWKIYKKFCLYVSVVIFNSLNCSGSVFLSKCCRDWRLGSLESSDLNKNKLLQAIMLLFECEPLNLCTHFWLSHLSSVLNSSHLLSNQRFSLHPSSLQLNPACSSFLYFLLWFWIIHYTNVSLQSLLPFPPTCLNTQLSASNHIACKMCLLRLIRKRNSCCAAKRCWNSQNYILNSSQDPKVSTDIKCVRLNFGGKGHKHPSTIF